MGRSARLLSKYTYYLRSIRLLLTGIANPLLTVRIFGGMAGSGVSTIRVRQGGPGFEVRGASDVWSVKETFLDRFYERYGFVVEPGWAVFDIGAGIGEFSLFAARIHASTRVVAFEPTPASFALLESNIRLNGVGNVHTHNVAVGAASGAMTLDVSGGDPLMYGSRSGHDGNGSGEIAVRGVSLADAMVLGGVERVDLLKLDCEGAEYAILYGASEAVLARIPRIVMEYHDWDCNQAQVRLARHLEDAGYAVEMFPNPVHVTTGFLRAWRR